MSLRTNTYNKHKQRLVEIALKYARMDMFRATFTEKDIVYHCHSDAKDQAAWLAKEMCHVAKDMLLALTDDPPEG